MAAAPLHNGVLQHKVLTNQRSRTSRAAAVTSGFAFGYAFGNTAVYKPRSA